jgi:hypothetical protein
MNGWVALGNGMAGFAVGLFLHAILRRGGPDGCASWWGRRDERKLDFVCILALYQGTTLVGP